MTLAQELPMLQFTYEFDGDNIHTECRRCHAKFTYTWHAKESLIIGDAMAHQRLCLFNTARRFHDEIMGGQHHDLHPKGDKGHAS